MNRQANTGMYIGIAAGIILLAILAALFAGDMLAFEGVNTITCQDCADIYTKVVYEENTGVRVWNDLNDKDVKWVNSASNPIECLISLPGYHEIRQGEFYNNVYGGEVQIVAECDGTKACRHQTVRYREGKTVAYTSADSRYWYWNKPREHPSCVDTHAEFISSTGASPGDLVTVCTDGSLVFANEECNDGSTGEDAYVGELTDELSMWDKVVLWWKSLWA